MLLIFCLWKKKKIYLAYVSKHNSNGEKQVTLLLIANGEGCKTKSEGRWWHYLAVKKISALLRGITSKNNDDFYFLNCLHSFRTKERTSIS